MRVLARYEEFDCHIWDGVKWTASPRYVAAEHPLAIAVDGHTRVVLLRTPGHDRELVVGYLLTQGIITSADDIERLEFSEDEEKAEVQLRRDAPGLIAAQGADNKARGCGLCATRGIETLASHPPALGAPIINPSDLRNLAELMRAGQELFPATGGTHAAALAPKTPVTADTAVVIREDVGRCNAVDKAIGAACLQGVDMRRAVLMVSGRMSLETVAKAAQAGIRAVAGIGAPTTASVRLARQLGMFLAGFVRGDSFTLYSGSPGTMWP